MCTPSLLNSSNRNHYQPVGRSREGERPVTSLCGRFENEPSVAYPRHGNL